MGDVQSSTQRFSLRPFAGLGDFDRTWDECDLLTLPGSSSDPYVVGFARSRRCVDAALRLRYEVFNLELNEGLSESISTGLDRDCFDEHMDHLVLLERESHRVVGTYRLQVAGRAIKNGGLYSAQEYDLSALEPYFDTSVEAGRACLATDHRTFRAMIAMWLGIGAYMNAHELRYLFGCCSLTSQDPNEGWRALRTVRGSNALHDSIFISALPEFTCGALSNENKVEDGYKLPKLFRTYLRLGAEVISEPALDREFGTVDFLMLMDGKEVAFSRLDVLQ